MEMYEFSNDFQKQVEKIPFFLHVKEPIESKFAPVASWSEAERHCTSIKWRDIQADIKSKYIHNLVEKHNVPLVSWNEDVRILRESIGPVIQDKLRGYAENLFLFHKVVASVRWDFLAIGMARYYEAVYADYYYHQLLKLYISGRFPCGWSGDWPEGKLILF